jgi:hypothetical protein
MSPLGLRSAKKKGEKPAKEPKAPKAPKAPKTPKAAAPAGARGVVVEKPKADIYTVMLILSFVAIVIACACLYAEMKAYDMILKPR